MIPLSLVGVSMIFRHESHSTDMTGDAGCIMDIDVFCIACSVMEIAPAFDTIRVFGCSLVHDPALLGSKAGVADWACKLCAFMKTEVLGMALAVQKVATTLFAIPMTSLALMLCFFFPCLVGQWALYTFEIVDQLNVVLE
ncbi:hypothetical protein I7I48_04787 [Histoplasma ohiense]|nr:hypothetical protein I7I48_04787 [Histoplasma ohiense (nom. inval.)]